MTRPHPTRWPSATALITGRYGLHPETIAHFRLHDVLTGTGGTQYPVIVDGVEVAQRYKTTPAEYARRGHKYLWLGTLRADVYHIDAVPAGCPVWLCAGEADVWVMTQAGLPAMSFLKGERCAPLEGLRVLAAHRPALVRILYDNDDTGRAGAERAYHALRAAGLRAEIVVLPDDIGPKGDAADLYRLVNHNDARFQRILAALPRRLPTTDPPQTRSPRQRGQPKGGQSQRYWGTGPSAAPNLFARVKAQADIVQLAQTLTPLKRANNGRYFTGLCPFHDDHTPSLVVYPATAERPGSFICWPCDLKGDAIELMRLALDRGLR